MSVTAHRLTGANVAFYFTGSKAQLLFDVQSSIDLTAPRDGLMAGLLMFEARNQPKTGLHKILSDDARNLLGTIYLSRGTLHVDANSPIADRGRPAQQSSREPSGSMEDPTWS